MNKLPLSRTGAAEILVVLGAYLKCQQSNISNLSKK